MSKKSNRSKLLKKGNTKREGEGQLYDKIMRENLQQLFLPLVIEQLNFKLKSFQPLPDKQPTTVIRETDAFLLIETYSKEEPKFILHLEFESKDDAEMIYRMSEYHGIELRKYRLPIKHVVVYLGEATPKMRTKLEPSEVFESFTLVNARNFSPKKWLDEEEPSKVIMAILGDYQKKNAELILTAIFDKLVKVCKTDVELKKYVEQLLIISRMRNLEELTVKLLKEMPITLDYKKSYLYKLGLQKAEDIIKKATEQLAKEKAVFEAKAVKAAKEKAALKAKAAKAIKEKAALKAKAAKAIKEKADLEAKAAKEKVVFIAKTKASIQKMQANTPFSDEEIMEFLNLDKKTFKQYLKEIKEEQQ